MQYDEFKPLTKHGFPEYGISRDGRVVNFATGKEKSQCGHCVSLWRNNKPTHYHTGKLVMDYYGSPLDLVTEEHKCNLGYLGFPEYTVIDDGRIWSHRSYKWLQPSIDGHMYYAVGMFDIAGKVHTVRVHRLVASAFVPNDDPVNKKEVNHINGNKLDNRVQNLEWVSGPENHKHAREHGLRRQALTDDQVHEICKMIIAGVRIADIAKKFNTSWELIGYIRRGGHPEITSQYGFKRIKQNRFTKIDYAKYDRIKRDKARELRAKLRAAKANDVE